MGVWLYYGESWRMAVLLAAEVGAAAAVIGAALLTLAVRGPAGRDTVPKAVELAVLAADAEKDWLDAGRIYGGRAITVSGRVVGMTPRGCVIAPPAAGCGTELEIRLSRRDSRYLDGGAREIRVSGVLAPIRPGRGCACRAG